MGGKTGSVSPSGLPGHIRKFCEGELSAYHTLVRYWHQIVAEAEAIHEEGGNLGSLDPIGRVDGGPLHSSPTERKHERRIKILTSCQAQAVQRRMEAIEHTREQLEEWETDILHAYYHHRMKPDEVVQVAGCTEEEVFDTRMKACHLLARAWGMV